MSTRGRQALEALLVGSASVGIGQGLLLALAPLTRAASDGVDADGVALLAPDSRTYLGLAGDEDWLARTPWNRVLLIGLLRLGASLGDAATFLVIVQTLLLVVASALAHHMAARVGGRAAGILGASVVAVNPLTAQWVRFVLSETLFFALVLIALFAADRILRGAGGRTAIPLLLGAALLATFLRPNGILVLGSALTVITIASTTRRRHLALLSVLVWIGVAGGLVLGLEAAGQPAERELAAQLHAGVVVEGTPDVEVRIAMPSPNDPEDVSNAAALRYVAGAPVAVARLAVSRIVVEMAQVRSHYPLPVNVGVGAVMALLAVATIVGARAAAARTLVRAAVILGTPIMLLVGATFATPEGRYGWGALVLSAPLAGIGAARILARVSGGRRRRQSADGPGIAR